MTDDHVAIVERMIAEHVAEDGCDCRGQSFPCPGECGGSAAWEPVMEGHYCTKCEYYDGAK
jgi:hypothetical protein